MPSNFVKDLANWWARWYMKAGHRRLGRALLEHADKDLLEGQQFERLSQEEMAGFAEEAAEELSRLAEE